MKIRILVDNSGYRFQNLGDIAMVQVAINRIRSNYPDAEILVFTESEGDFLKYCPGTISVDVRGRDQWLKARVFPIPLRLVPPKAQKKIGEAEIEFKLSFPILANFLRELISKARKKRDDNSAEFFSIIKSADFVVASGGGFINDEFPHHATKVLQTLLVASALGKPIAMFGQGIGPINNPTLVGLTAKVFPKLQVLGLRESKEGVSIARKTRIPDNHILVTGDDAIEIAFQNKEKSVVRDCIGVNVRRANYAGEYSEHYGIIGEIISELANNLNSTIVPIPIHIGDSHRDLRSILDLVNVESNEVEGARNITTPDQLINQVNRCRIVITGSYHAAVFALSQGIPVVGLVASEYYLHKFSGLAKQFELGCQIVKVGDDNFRDQLCYSIRASLRQGKDLSAKLTLKADEQVWLSKVAWRQFLT